MFSQNTVWKSVVCWVTCKTISKPVMFVLYCDVLHLVQCVSVFYAVHSLILFEGCSLTVHSRWGCSTVNYAIIYFPVNLSSFVFCGTQLSRIFCDGCCLTKFLSGRVSDIVNTLCELYGMSYEFCILCMWDFFNKRILNSCYESFRNSYLFLTDFYCSLKCLVYYTDHFAAMLISVLHINICDSTIFFSPALKTVKHLRQS